MNKVVACIDGQDSTPAVIDWAAWCALRLAVPLELLHVLERDPELAAVTDLSGAIGFGAQEALLAQLSELDAQRSKLAQEAGRQMLTAARDRAAAAGATQVDTRLRHGALVDNLLELEPDTRLFVMGVHHHASAPGRLHLDHQVERVIRSVKRPVLVATAAHFAAPTRFVVAFDGSATARKMVETVAKSPMLRGLPATLALAGDDSPAVREQLQQATAVLQGAGFVADSTVLPGEPEQALPRLVEAQPSTMLVMGAYGHSRIRQLIVGSTTTTLLRLSRVPVLILR